MKPIDVVKKTANMIGWEALQEELGVSRQCIWNWRSGNRKEPSASVILKCLELQKKAEPKQQKQKTQDLEDQFT